MLYCCQNLNREVFRGLCFAFSSHIGSPWLTGLLTFLCLLKMELLYIITGMTGNDEYLFTQSWGRGSLSSHLEGLDCFLTTSLINLTCSGSVQCLLLSWNVILYIYSPRCQYSSLEKLFEIIVLCILHCLKLLNGMMSMYMGCLVLHIHRL